METTFYTDPLGARRERNIIDRPNGQQIHLDSIEGGKWLLRRFNKLAERYTDQYKVFEDTDEAIDYLKFFRFIK